jgi:hypothetical protein
LPFWQTKNVTNLYKIVVFVPTEYAGKVRQAMGDAGAGSIGNYTYSTFSIRGLGRFLPEKGAKPTIGKVGKLEEVEEERIETVCKKEIVKGVIDSIRKVHPYEEIALDVYPVLTEYDFN